MKKIILFSLLLTSLYSDAKIYMGANYGSFNEKFSDDLDAESSAESVALKIGYGDRKAYAVEFSIDRYENKSKIFSDNDQIKYSVNVDLITSFDFAYINPFLKAGFGAGTMQIERELQDRLNFGSFNLGLGTFIPITEHFDLELGYSYKAISYQDIDLITEKTSYKSNINTVYLGFNVRF